MKVSVLYKKRVFYRPLESDEYLNRFGVRRKNGNLKVIDKKKLAAAFSKAWENRNYEIDKFWSRAAYFWGFIALAFAGFASLVASDFYPEAQRLHLDLYLILIGNLFSLAWYLVIRGSKFWQENWEAHVDHLEKFVSGPLYKTIFNNGHRSFSVSKITEVLALVVIVVWLALLVQYVVSNVPHVCASRNIDWHSLLAIIVAGLFAMALAFGYAAGDYKSNKHRFFDRQE